MAGLKPFDLAAARGAGIRNALGVQKFQQNALAGGAGGIDIGMVNPRDFTAESIQRARQTGNINDLVRYNAPKTPIKVDAGDAWEIYNPLNNELIKRIPKKLGPNQTPDYFSQVEGAKVEGRTGAELEVAPDIRKRKVADAEALKQVDLSYDPPKKRAEAVAGAEGTEEVRARVAKKKDEKAFKSYDVVKTNVMNSMNSTILNGYFLGKLPAASASAQIAEQAVNILFPAIKKIVREGESGVFTDQDALDVRRLLPNRETHPEALPMVMWQLDSWVASRLGQPQPPKPEGFQDEQSALPEGVTEQSGETYEQKRKRLLGYE